MKTNIANLAKSGERGFTLTEIMIVIAIIALLASLAMPTLGRARDNSRLNAIYNNLRQVEAAKDQWALENNKPTGTPIESMDVLMNYLRGSNIQDVVQETYKPNAVGERAEAELPGTIHLGPYGPGQVIPAP